MKTLILEDKDNFIFKLPKIIYKIFTKKYQNQGMVYINTFTVKWLENIEILTTSEKRAAELSWKFFHEKYPEYRKKIQLF